jgi:hypothetical protein
VSPVKASDTAGYSGRPLAQKLGIKLETTVVLVAAPDAIEALLEPLPDGVVVRRGNRGRRQTTIWFVTSRREFERRFEAIAGAVGEGTLWMAWPKGSSGVETDMTEDTIREVALPRGLVDSKVCAIDATWSGLRLTKRRTT